MDIDASGQSYYSNLLAILDDMACYYMWLMLMSEGKIASANPQFSPMR
jgi:hypothetical protein